MMKIDLISVEELKPAKNTRTDVVTRLLWNVLFV